MVGRCWGARAAGGLRTGLLSGVLALSVVMLVARPARAFCRTTTCSVTPCAPRDCLADDATDRECLSACPPARCLATDANGCLTKGIPLRWTRRCLSFSVQATGSPALGLGYTELVPLAEQAFGLWTQADCGGGATPGIAVTSLGALTCDMLEQNLTGPNANGVMFRDQSWRYGAEVIGLTTVSFSSKTGEIRGADMQINTFDYAGEFTPEGLSYTIAHESGHFFGLDHSRVSGSLMFFQSSAGVIGAPVLIADDVAGICTVYPPSSASSSGAPMCDPDPRAGAFEPAQGFAPDCGGDVQAACTVAPLVSDADAPWVGWPAVVGIALAARRRPSRP